MRSFIFILCVGSFLFLNSAFARVKGDKKSKSKNTVEISSGIDSVALLSEQNANLVAQLEGMQRMQDSLENADLRKLKEQDSLARLALYSLSDSEKSKFYDSLVSNWYYENLPLVS